MKPTKKQKEIIKRLMDLSKAQVEICSKALSDDANEFDIRLACYFAHLQNIK